MTGRVVEAPQAAIPAAFSEDSWTAEGASESLRRFLEKGQLEPGRALVLSAEMAEEIRRLAGAGFQTVALDTDGAGLKQLAGRVRAEAPGLITIEADFLAMAPSFSGPVETVVDRLYVHGLDAPRRAAWIHQAGRVLPLGGHLVGYFLIGRSPQGPPFPMTLDALRKLMGRHFVTEVLEPVGTPVPGKPQAYRGLFVRK